MKLSYALVLLMVTASYASSVEVTLYGRNDPRHIGDGRIPAWDTIVYGNEGTNLVIPFFVEGIPNNASLDMLAYDVTFPDNPVKLNNQTIATMCKVTGWSPCRISLPPGKIKEGTNTLEIDSIYHGESNDFDDFMMKNIKITAEYTSYYAYIIPIKVQSTYEARLGEQVNVTISLTNVGVKPAYNVTANDVKPSGTYVVSGVTETEFTPLLGGDIIFIRYIIAPQSIGEYKSWPGRLRYYVENSTMIERDIEPTKFIVKPPRPQVYIYKTISNENLTSDSSVDIQITLANNGTETAYDVMVYDSVPKGLKVNSGTPNATFVKLLSGENKTYNYSITSNTADMFSISASLVYKDYGGESYERKSNPVRVTSVQKQEQRINEPFLSLAVIAILIIALSITYTKVKG